MFFGTGYPGGIDPGTWPLTGLEFDDGNPDGWRRFRPRRRRFRTRFIPPFTKFAKPLAFAKFVPVAKFAKPFGKFGKGYGGYY